MQDKNSGEFAVDLSTLAENPHCPHGPTILFRRSTDTSTKDAYYACSAYRDSKECRFFEAFSAKKTSKQPQSTATTGGKKRKRDELLESHRPTTSRSDGTKVSYCTRCSRILEKNDVEGHKHSEVELVDPRFPSRFLLPLSGKQAEAQYFFSGKTTNFLLNLLKSQEAKTIINIGCPRLHEAVIAAKNGSKSFLLDLDNRFAQFCPHNAFAQYNMFNNHFFSETGRDDFQSYVAASSSKDLFVVMDPPFAGRVEVLAHNLRQLFSDIGGPCSVAWIFPYFMEKHIAREFPGFTMLDYKVEYDNHRKFKDAGKGETRGSPVRIFTNVPPSSVPHPADEGYRFCRECDRFSARENAHCLSCGLCPSKDGKTWRHCRTCAKCVKSDWNHCKKCQRCHAWNCMAKKEIVTGGNGHVNKKRKRS